MPEVPTRDVLPVGKLPAADLAAALARLAPSHPRLLVGPCIGEDAAVIDLDGRRLVVATDPVTFATERIGWYAVHVNANDIAVMGAVPLWFFAAVLLPEGVSRAQARAVLDDLGATCAELGVPLAGGHTEITAGLPHPIVVGQMIGEARAEDLVTKAGLREGDRVILTRGAAIEGTALLARELAGELGGRIEPARLERARDLLFAPGISVVRAARVATAAAKVHAMHDPTEGGVLTGLHELATAAGLGLRVFADRIPILPETRVLCDALEADPLTLIASGALLIATAPGDERAVLAALHADGIPAAVVGEVRPADEGIELERDGLAVRFEPPARDEVARLLEARSAAAPRT
jgi:hydrogenase maturation factor